MLRRGVVPVVARRRLVVPDQLARVGLEREDRRQIEVVAAAGAAHLARSRASRCPCRRRAGRARGRRPSSPTPCRRRRPSTSVAGPGLRAPCRARAISKRLRRIAGHGVEAPGQLAGLRVVGRDVAAHAELGAAVADDDLALDDARRAGDRVRLASGRRSPPPTSALPVARVERDQPAVERADVDLALVEPRRRGSRRRSTPSGPSRRGTFGS